MALGVLQLHECRLVHTNLSLKYFKVSLQLHHNFLSLPHNTLIKFTNSSRYILFSQIFPIDEPPSHTNLRVKLVSLKHARDYNTHLSQRDILQLGLSMCAVAIGKCQCDAVSYLQTDREARRSYDVSLMLLVDWMIDDDPSHRASIADVIRHPYFMGIHETEAFALALHGGLFHRPQAGLVTQESLNNALDEMSGVLLNEIDGIFGTLSAEPEPCDEDDVDCDSGDDGDDGDDGSGGGGGGLEFAAGDDCEDNGPFWAFAVQAHKFLVDNGHTIAPNRKDIAQLCNPSAKPTLFPHNIRLIPESERAKKGKKGLRRAFESYPALFAVQTQGTAVFVHALPLGAFAFQAHKFLTAYHHTSKTTALNAAQMCDPEAKLTLHPQNIMLVPDHLLKSDYLVRTFCEFPSLFGFEQRNGACIVWAKCT